MLEVTFTVEETGEEYVVDATGHATVMHAARDNDVPNIEGECGGDMTCATCHVYLDCVPSAYLTEPGAAELDMLEVVANRTESSRLGCQLPVDDRIDGLRLRVPAV
jgi:2Fe-2S ferredoxin